MAITPEATPPSESYGCLNGNQTTSDFWRSPRDLATLVLLLLPLLVFAATLVDGTYSMQGESKGFAQHYGFWAIFATTPALLRLAGHMLDRYVSILSKPDGYLSDRATPDQRAEFDRIVGEHINSLALNSRLRYVLYFGMCVGLAFYIINIHETWDPYPTYGHDVFDAWRHKAGYFLTKLYLLPVFVYAYPVAIFIAAQVTWSMYVVLRFLCEKEVLEISFFHEDNCGGTSCFGEVNLLVMTTSAFLFVVLIGMFITHDRTYFVTRSGLVFCSIVMIVESLASVWAIHSFVKKKKQARLSIITKSLDEDLDDSLKNKSTFRNDLLAARNHVHGIHTFPYAARMLVVVNGLRFAPAVIAIATFVNR